jgi:uncharacterized protein YciI
MALTIAGNSASAKLSGKDYRPRVRSSRLEVGSLGEARRLAEADPAIANGFMVIVDVKPFMAMISPV